MEREGATITASLKTARLCIAYFFIILRVDVLGVHGAEGEERANNNRVHNSRRHTPGGWGGTGHEPPTNKKRVDDLQRHDPYQVTLKLACV